MPGHPGFGWAVDGSGERRVVSVDGESPAFHWRPPLDRIDVGGFVFILLALDHSDWSAVFMPVQGEQGVSSRRQPPDVVLVIALQLHSQPGRKTLEDEENEEAAGLLVIRAQLHHLRQELWGAAAAQQADRQQPLDPLIFGESVLLQEVLLQEGVRLVIVWVGDRINPILHKKKKDNFKKIFNFSFRVVR